MIKYDKEQAKKEALLKKRVIEDQKTKAEYFEKLRNNDQFKKYVIEGIIDKAIESHKAENFSIKALLEQKPEETRASLLSARASLEQLKTIRQAILTGKL